MCKKDKKYERLDKNLKKMSIAEKITLKAVSMSSDIVGYERISVLDVIKGVIVFFCCIVAMLCEILEKHCKKLYIRRLLKYRLEEIAIDVNDLIKNRERIKCYGNDFTYNAVTDKKYLKNIEIICGDAHFEALDDTSCLGNLKKITGSVYY